MVSASMPLRIQNNNRTWINWLILLLVGCLSLGIYILISAKNLRTGFPLDDAWIHQTYARNLALNGEWAFTPGIPSGGSTSPLWTIILASGYLLKLSPFTWVFLLGGLCLAVLAIQIDKGIRILLPEYSYRLPIAGILILFEFHFVWSAVSGMETLLHALIILNISLVLMRTNPSWILLGLLTGLSTWIRPDGLTLVIPIILTGLVINKGWKEKTRSVLWMTSGFLILFVPYLYFNYSLTGAIFPTTFYAKQAEYVGWQADSIIKRSLDFLLNFLTGPAVILLPPFLLETIQYIKKRNLAQLFLILWLIGFAGLYMLKLPAYQHGRYLIPEMPVYFLFGLMGLFRFLKSVKLRSYTWNLVRVGWAATTILLGAGFWLLGMRAYIKDVEFIETEMVDTARWVAENIPEGAIIAAHDIGALGYYDTHPLVDLAGLITPEVIPILLNENSLAEYLDSQNVTHLVIFPDWYPTLTADLVPIFSTDAMYAPSVGGTNMTVYLWR